MLVGLVSLVVGSIGQAMRIGAYVSDFDDVLAGEAGDMEAIKEPLMEVLDGLGEFPTGWHVLIMVGVVFLLLGAVVIIRVFLQGKPKGDKGSESETIV